MGLYRDTGKENGNYYSIFGVIKGYWKRKWKLLEYIRGYTGILEENGNYYSIFGVI